MRIGIIGSGNMGRALGVRAAALGHAVCFGARDPAAARTAADLAGSGATSGSNDAAAAFGDMLIWTVREPDPSAVLTRPDALDGKVVVNLNNRDYAADVQGGRWFDRSIGEQAQALAPKARVVKALNVVAMETLDTAPERLREAGAQVFIAGNDAAAKAEVTTFLGQFGFAAIDLGAGPVAMRASEALGDVIRLLMIAGGRGGRANLQLRMLPEPDLGRIGARAPSYYA